MKPTLFVGCTDKKLEDTMVNSIEEGRVWIPVVGVSRHERTGEFVLIRYGAKEDSGMSFVVDNFIHVAPDIMARDGLKIVLVCLSRYRLWPAKKKLRSELGDMEPRLLSKFVREHKFVDVVRRDQYSLCVSPSHRVGRGWRGVTSYIEEEMEIKMPTTQESFLKMLIRAFDMAT